MSLALPVALIAIPAVAAIAAYFLKPAARAAILVGTALAHTVLVTLLWLRPPAASPGAWLAVDELGLIILTLVSVLFLAVAQYAVGYLEEEEPRGGRAFGSCLLAFLAAASLVTLSQHLALMWIGMETTTLAVAPLIFHRHDRRSLEAVWKYLVLSSVGIALALLGIFLLATAQPSGEAGGRPLMLDDMITRAAALDPVWLRAAFIFILIGFGTKMGVAPMHAWKPDTYGEAPSLVSGLMSGALTSCAFLGLARVAAIAFAAGAGPFIRPALIALGLLSLVIAAAFMIGQGDIKRLLAYSSVEHMGLLVLGLGVGGVGAYGAILHALNNGLAKGLMFLAVGNIVLVTGSSSAAAARGLLRRAPKSAVLLFVGLFAVTGSPPFGMFISEFTILRGIVGERYPWVAAAVIALLAVIFVAIASMILDMIYDEPDSAVTAPAREERRWLVVAPGALALLVLLLGVYLPPALQQALTAAATVVGGRAP